MKGNEKDCICARNDSKHSKECDAYRLSGFLKQVVSVISPADTEDKNGHKINESGKLIYDERCNDGKCDSPADTKEWEQKFLFLFSPKYKKSFTKNDTVEMPAEFVDYVQELSRIKNFIRSLIHSAEERGRKQHDRDCIDQLHEIDATVKLALSQRQDEILRKAEELRKDLPDNVEHPDYEKFCERSRIYDEALDDFIAIIKKRMI